MIVQACKYVATCQSLDVFRMLFIQICYFFVCVPCAAPAFYCAWNFLLFYLMLLFSKLSGAAEVAQYTLQLRFHILYTYTQSLFFLLLSGVCKHSSFIHSSLWALFLFSRRQMLLCYIDCVNFHHHLWCLTNVIMHYSLSSQCIWSNKFCLWGIFFFYSMKGWGWREGSLSACFGDMGARQTLASCVHLSCRSFDMIFSLWIMLNIKHQYLVKKWLFFVKKKKKYLQVIASNAKPTTVEPCYNEVTSNIKIPSL